MRFLFKNALKSLSFPFQLNGDIQIKNPEQNGGRCLVLRARGSGGSSAASNGTNIW